MQVRKQQLELDMEQQTDSKSGKEHTVYYHSAYLTYIQNTSCEMLGWMKPKLESRLPGQTSMMSEMQRTPSYDRKQRGIEDPLDESERGE